MYKKTNDLGLFQSEIYREYVERTIDDMDEIGSLVRNGLEIEVRLLLKQL